MLRLRSTIPFLLILAACQSDVTSNSTDNTGSTQTDPPPTASAMTCPACVFEPVVYTRRTGTPVTEVVTFEADPAGAYDLEIHDFGDRGANARVILNGDTLPLVRGHFAGEVPLAAENTLETRLTGKPGSRLAVRLFQEVASVTVTPGTAQGRVGATRQFTATAYDRNGVVIPRQTFSWTSLNPTIATVNATGLARTVGAQHEDAAFRYLMETSGSGTVQIEAHADQAPPDMTGRAAWTVTQGFVYITYRAPRALDSDSLATRPAAQAIRFDVMQLQAMANRCSVENANTAWRADGEEELLFRQCYPVQEMATPTRTPSNGGYEYGVKLNVGLYGRYCGGGQPAGTWWTLASNGGYPPKDPIDGLCMEHDVSERNHDLHASDDVLLATCLVRWGIDTERLYEDGVLVEPGSARWDAFWAAWPDMADARAYWQGVTSIPCSGAVYVKFKVDRGIPLF